MIRRIPFFIILLITVNGSIYAAVDTLSAAVEGYEKEARFLEESINKERETLIQSLNMLVTLSPEGKYVDGFMFRLSELLYEKAVIDFSNKVAVFEKEYARYEKGEIKEEPVYPVYDFTKVLSVYRDILKRNPDSTMVEQVLYYTGICYKKADEGAKANQAFEVLVKRYPGGTHYLDALMEMGAYYFNNPSSWNGKGYDKAIETYKEVLKYRDSDKFIEALYRLAWSYYMIDKYNEAVTVFRHLIEEIDVAESYGATQAGMEKNPMFKDEAIEYISVSLCEVGDLTRVSQFLEMIGNKVYALLILNRMGGYYEEQMDFESAMGCYRLMLSKYPYYGQVLDGNMGVIRCYERMGTYDSAQAEKELFFKTYSKGTAWQRKVFEPVWQSRADSLSIKCILSVSQYRFTQARSSGDPKMYETVLSLNNRLASIYPDAAETYEALWVNAIIYEQNLFRLDSARTLYLDISRKPETAHKQQAAINAIAVSQRLEETEKGEEGKVTAREQKIVDACQNYVNLLPENTETIDVAFIPASIFFNRRIYDRAYKVYELILSKIKDPKDPKRFEALLYSGQCLSGLKDFEKAEKTFDELYQVASDGKFKDEAKVRRVEAAFQNAEIRRHAKDYAAAAALFLSIEKKYPEFINMDIVLFNAADAYERLMSWKNAAEVYRRVQQKFPFSKLADGALFNGATCFENDSAYAEAIACYELILSNYPSSVKARDALYNIGLCYEKMKAYDKMAEAQERYAEAYPDSKEVEALLFSSAKYFLEGNRPDRAKKAFENFVRRFPGSNGEVEARYKICELLIKENDKRGAETAFETLLQRNDALRPIGRNNDYFAGEAAFQLAEIVRSRFEAVEFKLPVKSMEVAQKEKADLMKKVIEGYTRVVQLKSERLFEAAYNIGRCYTTFADAFVNQERDTKLDPTKMVVAERDLQLSAVALYERCIEPHSVNIGFAKALPSDTMLKPEQRKYVELSKQAIVNAYVSLGSFYVKAAEALYGAPVPAKIKKMPVQYYLYRQKLAETVQPIYVQAFEKNLASKAKIIERGYNDSIVNIINDSVVSVLYKRGNIFYELSSEMLNKPEIPPEIKGDEREEAVFQIEDVAFEIQDKALRSFEEGYDYVQRESIGGPWRRKILEILKQLDPQTYTPKEVLQTLEFTTGEGWMTRTDSIAGWNKLAPFDSVWTPVK
ncbi:MAG: tetratricopeptide repeat protein, partial [Fibrobacteres bacterium]|nr:tetratricopeptide repeat protein [Fibrobacterota bacterium]